MESQESIKNFCKFLSENEESVKGKNSDELYNTFISMSQVENEDCGGLLFSIFITHFII